MTYTKGILHNQRTALRRQKLDEQMVPNVATDLKHGLVVGRNERNQRGRETKGEGKRSQRKCENLMLKVFEVKTALFLFEEKRTHLARARLQIGCNTLIGPFGYISLSGPGMLTHQGRCRAQSAEKTERKFRSEYGAYVKSVQTEADSLIGYSLPFVESQFRKPLRCFTFDHSADGFARGEGAKSIFWHVFFCSLLLNYVFFFFFFFKYF